MHAVVGDSDTASAERQVMADVVFVVGTSRPNMANPIMGPPEMTFFASVLKPPAASISSATQVPMRHSKLDGFATASPEIVTTLEIRGFPRITAS